MAIPHKLFVLKLNKNKFPHEIHRFLYYYSGDAGEKERTQKKRELRSWYQETFQKNNRWNKAKLYHWIKCYSNQELKNLVECFSLLFNLDRSYNQIFVKYIHDFQHQKDEAKQGKRLPQLRVDQRTYEELIALLGSLRRAGKIRNNYQQIARILKEMMDPDISLEESTIIDRLKNKKGYK